MKKIFAVVSLIAFLVGCTPQPKETVIQIGHFPNISHAQALVAHQLSRQGKGWFEERLGKDVKVQWRIFNAGPSAMESMFARAVDIAYVGPNPAINAFVKTRGRDIRIIAGSADGGASLVVNPKLNITKPADFKGKKIGTPQLGNTQDVACRAWLIENGIPVTLTSGEARVIATSNPEQLPLFKKGNLDAVWTIEPWVTRLEQEAGGKIYMEQKDAITTVVVSCNRVFRKHPELVKKFVKAHQELTDWINKNPEEAQKLVVLELEALTGGKISEQLVKDSWKRLTFTSQVNKAEVQKFVDYAYKCGFLRTKMKMDNFYWEK